jgi:two-component system C4-dicarboxylate transport response regulator DctD
MSYDWPGNIRELRNIADCYALGIAHQGSVTNPMPGFTLIQAVENYERALIAAELARQNGNVARTCQALSLPRTTLHDKMRKYGMS